VYQDFAHFSWVHVHHRDASTRDVFLTVVYELLKTGGGAELLNSPRG